MKIFKKEHEVSELAIRFLDSAEACVLACSETLENYFEGRFEAASAGRARSSSAETEADRLRREIGDKLSSGAYLPLLRGDIYCLIDSLDHVPNAAEACASFFLSEKPSIPAEFNEAFRELARTSFGIIEPLHEAVGAFFQPKGKIENIRELHRAVSIRESDVDQLEWDLTVRIFDSGLDLASKQHLRKAIDRIVRISDRAEDSSDQLELVALKSVV